MIWTDEKIKKLLELYPSMENDEISDLLGIKRGTIITKANSMGLYKTAGFMNESRKKRKQHKQTEWSEEEENFILDNYRILSNSDISIELNKTRKSVIRKIGRMGLKRTKAEMDFLRAKKCKANGRDVSYDFVRNEALKYSTRSEFSYIDNYTYKKAREFGLLEEFKNLKIGGSISIPQLILKEMLEHMMNMECSFNDRNAIGPLEIDCYFDKWRIGWEYNGKRFHTDEKDRIKKKICEESGIRLFIIHEKTDNHRNYVENIKTQLIQQLACIEKITGTSINLDALIEYKPRLNFLFMLKSGDIEKCKYKNLSDIRKNDNDLYKRIKKYNLIDHPSLGIVNDTRKLRRFETIDEYIEYLLAEKNKYSNFSQLARTDHLYRRIKKYSVTAGEIKKRICF